MLNNNDMNESDIQTGFPDLDCMIEGGFKKGKVYVLVTHPSVGTNSFALNIIQNIISREHDGIRKNVMFFSSGMKAEQVAQHIWCLEAGVALSAIVNLNLTWAINDFLRLKIQIAAEDLKGAQLSVDETADISFFELYKKSLKQNKHKRLDFIVTDYLQQMKSDKSKCSKNYQLETNSHPCNLKKLARKLNVPILVFGQLNYKIKELEDKQKDINVFPVWDNLKEIESVKQDAEVIMFLQREQESVNAEDKEFHDWIGAKLIVWENNHEKNGIVNLDFSPRFVKFRSQD